jgi:hypothetical protein
MVSGVVLETATIVFADAPSAQKAAAAKPVKINLRIVTIISFSYVFSNSEMPDVAVFYRTIICVPTYL